MKNQPMKNILLKNILLKNILSILILFVIFSLSNNETISNPIKSIELPTKATIMFIKDIDDKLYIGTRVKLHIYTPKTNKWENIEFPDKKYPTCIASNDKLIVIGTNKGIMISETIEGENKNQFSGVETDFSNTMVNDIFADKSGVYFATNEGVFHSDPNIDSVENITTTMKVKSIESVTKLNDRIIVGSSDGIFDTSLDILKWRIFKLYMRDVKSTFVNDTSFYVSSLKEFKMCNNYETELRDIIFEKPLGEVFKVSAKGNNVIALARGGVHISNDNGKTWKSIPMDEKSFKAGLVSDKFYFGSFKGNLYYIDFADFGLIGK